MVTQASQSVNCSLSISRSNRSPVISPQLSLNPEAEKCKELENFGAKVVPHQPGRIREMVETLQQTGADTIYLISPVHEEKCNITAELIETTKKASIPNVYFVSLAGCDLAEKEKQPRLHEFIELETLAMSTKGVPSTSTGKSVVAIRWARLCFQNM